MPEGKRGRGAELELHLWTVLTVVAVMAISCVTMVTKVSADTEPNDGFPTAEPIAPGAYSGSLGVTPPSDGNDYYSLTLSSPSLWVYVNVTIPGGGPTMNIYLMDSAHNMFGIISGAGPGTHQTHSVFFNPQTVFIAMNLVSGSGSYQMEVFVTATKLDSAPPRIQNLRPPDMSIKATKTPAIAADYVDIDTEIDEGSVVLKVDGVNVTSSATVTSTGVSYTPAPLTEGNHSAYLAVKDIRHNLATQMWNFTVDTFGPTITNLVPTNNSSTNDDTPLIAANYSDPSGVNLAYLILIVDDVVVTSNATVTGSGFSYTPTTPLADGMHYAGLAIKDNVGNVAIQAWIFKVQSKSFLEESWWVVVAIVIAIIAVLAVALLLTRRKKPAEMPPSEQTPHQEPGK